MPRLVLALVSCLFTLALAETGMRVVSPGIFRVWEPGLTATFTPRAGVLPGVHGVSRFAINAIGVRGDEPLPGPAYRILTLGGSTTECLFLDQGESWPALVQEQLTSPGKRVVVESAGKSGHSTRHHLVQLTHLLPQHRDIDAVVILAGVNDVQLWLEKPAAPFEPTGPADYRKAFMVAPARFTLAPDAPFYQRLQLYRLFHSESGVDPADRHLVQDFEGLFYTNLRERRRAAPKRTALPDLPGALAAYRGHLEALVDVAAQHKVELVLMTQPVLWRADLPPELDGLLWFGWGDRPGEYYATSALAEAMEAHNQVMRDVCQKKGLHASISRRA
ncbi:MAG: GDSL-type esterase/lipase family protein [Byssovorax sp.]